MVFSCSWCCVFVCFFLKILSKYLISGLLLPFCDKLFSPLSMQYRSTLPFTRRHQQLTGTFQSHFNQEYYATPNQLLTMPLHETSKLTRHWRKNTPNISFACSKRNIAGFSFQYVLHFKQVYDTTRNNSHTQMHHKEKKLLNFIIFCKN